MAEAHSPDHLRLDATVARLKQQGQAGIDLSLDRLRRALEGLGAPQTRLPPVIHVAGTNGKGSVCAFLRAGLEAMGLTVHAYTSPHLLSFTERFRVAGDLIAPDRLADLLESLSEPAGTLALPPLSFFERSTAAAFVAFSSISADVTLLEVGMGGRDDATNVIPDPAVSVITPVGLDHCGFLGPDLASIARTKAGILRAAVPAMIGPQAPEALAVIEQEAESLGAPLRSFAEIEAAWQDVGAPVSLRLIGPHQQANAALAWSALKAFCARTGRSEPDPGVAQTMVATIDWPGRLQQVDVGLWVDGGHNAHAAQAMVEALKAEGFPFVDAVIGMLDSKDRGEFLRALGPSLRHVVCVPLAEGSFDGTGQGVPPDRLAEDARLAGVEAVSVASSVGQALDRLRGQARSGGHSPILITGSLILAAEVLRQFNTGGR